MRTALFPRVFASVVCLSLLAAFLAFSTAQVEAALKAGTAEVKITPPEGVAMAGYYHPRGSQGVLDDLFAKALVLDDGDTRVALVSCDLISIPREVIEEARRIVEEKTDISGGSVLISATHTHTGPALRTGSSFDEVLGASKDLNVEYTRQLPEKIAQAVIEADAARGEVHLSYDREDAPKLAYIRRFWMKDGSIGWNPGKRNPQVIRPIGEVDEEVGVVYLEQPNKTPVATYVNFALHTDTTGGSAISADYPGALARLLAKVRGTEMVTLFGNGTCGDINHINVQSAAPQKGPEEATRLATILAAAVCKAYLELETPESTRLAVRSRMVKLPLAPVSEEDVAEAERIMASDEPAPFLQRVQARKALDVHARNGKPIEAEVQVITLGKELAWVALPGEIFVDLGLSIKAASPFEQTMPVELANGAIGYVPSRSAYAEGQYEVISARMAEGSGEMLVTAAIELLEAMHAEAVEAQND